MLSGRRGDKADVAGAFLLEKKKQSPLPPRRDGDDIVGGFLSSLVGMELEA